MMTELLLLLALLIRLDAVVATAGEAIAEAIADPITDPSGLTAEPVATVQIDCATG